MSLPTEYVDELNNLNKEVLSKKPTNIIEFCYKYFEKRLKEENSQHHSDDVDPTAKHNGTSSNQASSEKSQFSSFKNSFFSGLSGNDNHNQLADSKNLPINFNVNRRTSVSAESLNPSNLIAQQSQPSTATITEKTPEQLKRLKSSVGKNFLFSSLDEESLKSVFLALQEKKVEKNTVVIKQGDENADYFYIVEKGSFNFLVNGDLVGKAETGSSFGELALMYNAPRAATVIASEDSILWCLDRMTFRKILLDKTSTKRKLYENFLKEVSILKTLNNYEIGKLADSLSTVSFGPEEVIIKQGDVGDNFYIIENGQAEVVLNDEVVGKLDKGNYFGEVALINDSPRTATVKSLTSLSLVTLDKNAFKRLLGNVEFAKH